MNDGVTDRPCRHGVNRRVHILHRVVNGKRLRVVPVFLPLLHDETVRRKILTKNKRRGVEIDDVCFLFCFVFCQQAARTREGNAMVMGEGHENE